MVPGQDIEEPRGTKNLVARTYLRKIRRLQKYDHYTQLELSARVLAYHYVDGQPGELSVIESKLRHQVPETWQESMTSRLRACLKRIC